MEKNYTTGKQDFSTVYTAFSGGLPLASLQFGDPITPLYHFSAINHSLGFSFESWQGSGFNEFDCGSQFQGIPQFLDHFFLEPGKVCQFPTEEIPVDLNFDRHLIQVIDSVDIYHKLIAYLGDLQEHMLDLGRKYVDAPDNQHVLLKIPEVGNQFMVYIDRINHLDEMTVEVEINRDFFSGELADLARLQKKVVKELRDALELRTTVKLVEPGSLPRFEGKAKRVIDRREVI
jgi:hypothetical protein